MFVVFRIINQTMQYQTYKISQTKSKATFPTLIVYTEHCIL